MDLKGSKTEKNILTAFAGESQARNRYTYFTSKAKKDGYVQISRIFEETAGQEKEHAERLFKLLKGGGWLFNLDEMSTVSEDAYMNTLKYWAKHVDQVRSQIPKDLLDFYLAWQEKFRLWKIRNIDNAAKPKSKGDDIHEGYIEQMQWLRQTGFVEVDLFVKFQLWSLIGGRKI